MGIKGSQLELMQRCLAKMVEIASILRKRGVKVHKVSDISLLDVDFGTATLVVDLDFRQKHDK